MQIWVLEYHIEYEGLYRYELYGPRKPGVEDLMKTKMFDQPSEKQARTIVKTLSAKDGVVGEWILKHVDVNET